MQKYRFIFSGAGGQGVITAAIVLAEAAVMYEHLNATQAQSYGPEARGGATRSDVIIHDAAIRYPKVIRANVLVCLTQEAYNKYAGTVRPGGLLLTDQRFVSTSRMVDARQVQLPMYDAVMEQLGKPIAFNICMLGAVLGVTRVISPDSVLNVLRTRFPKGIDMNRRALDLGLELVKTYKGY